VGRAPRCALGADFVAPAGVRCEHAVEAGQVEVGFGDEGGQAVEQLGGLEDELTGTARAPGPLEGVGQPSVGELAQQLLREGLAGAITDKAE